MNSHRSAGHDVSDPVERPVWDLTSIVSTEGLAGSGRVEYRAELDCGPVLHGMIVWVELQICLHYADC